MKYIPFRPLIVSGALGSFLIIVSALFKIQHYPYTDLIGLAGYVIFMFFWIWILISIIQSKLNAFQKLFWFVGALVLSIPVSWIYYFKYFNKPIRK